MNEHSTVELSRAAQYERNADVAAHMLRAQAEIAATRTAFEPPAPKPRRFAWLPVHIHIHITR